MGANLNDTLLPGRQQEIIEYAYMKLFPFEIQYSMQDV
jgi:hypothetical protein